MGEKLDVLAVRFSWCVTGCLGMVIGIFLFLAIADLTVRSLPHKEHVVVVESLPLRVYRIRDVFNKESEMWEDESGKKFFVPKGEKPTPRRLVRIWIGENKTSFKEKLIFVPSSPDFRVYAYTSWWEENGYRVAFERSWDERFPPSQSWREVAVIFPNGLFEPIKTYLSTYSSQGSEVCYVESRRGKIMFSRCFESSEEFLEKSGTFFDITRKGREKILEFNL